MPQMKELKELTLLVSDEKKKADTAWLACAGNRSILPCLSFFVGEGSR